MTEEGFLHRLREFGYRSILYGHDLKAALLGTVGVFLVFSISGAEIHEQQFAVYGTLFAQSMLAVIIAGVSILVSFTDLRFLEMLKKEGVLRRLFFAFEATAMIALLSTAVGLAYLAAGPATQYIYLFVFLIIYLIAAVARLVSMIVSYGNRRAIFAVVDDLPDDLGEGLSDDRDDDSGEDSR